MTQDKTLKAYEYETWESTVALKRAKDAVNGLADVFSPTSPEGQLLDKLRKGYTTAIALIETRRENVDEALRGWLSR